MTVDFCTKTPSCWIIAYGNAQRGDDGIGPFVAQTLDRQIGGLSSVGIISPPQLDLALLEEIQGADHLIFVDACVEELKEGVRWSSVEPELNGWAVGSHHLEPKVLMGLLKLLYDCQPVAWIVSIHGSNFEYGEGLAPETRRCAQQAAVQIVDWLFMHRIAIPDISPKRNNIETRG